MLLLPKENPLYEHIDARKINLSDMLEKLGKGGFTGYVNYASAPDREACCIFANGIFFGIVYSENSRDRTGFEAITALFDAIVTTGGELNIYRTSANLAMCAHALLSGHRLFKGDEVRQVDIKGILARLKNQEINGVVKFYTANRTALMFYKDGQPIGFYHDSAQNIEMTPDESRKVAALPGARVDVLTTKPLEELTRQNLLHLVNLDKLWESAVTRHASVRERESIPAPISAASPDKNSDALLAELIDDLQEVAMAYLSREGRKLVEKLLQEAGGSEILLNGPKVELFLGRLAQEATTIDSHARIGEMTDLMRSEITGRLAGRQG